MRMQQIFFVLAAVGLLLIIATSGCKHEPDVFPEDPFAGNGNGDPTDPPVDPEIICDEDTTYYVQDVLPIIMRTCALPNPNNPEMTCHHAGHEDDLNFNIFGIFQEEALDGEVYDVLTDNDPDDHMPPPGEVQLTQDEMNAIFAWISQGAQYNSCESCDTTNVTYSSTIQPIIAFNCTGGCHAGSTPTGGLDLTNFNVVQTVAQDGRLEGAIKHLPGYTPMPFSSSGNVQLSQCKIDKFMIWINDGAPNN